MKKLLLVALSICPLISLATTYNGTILRVVCHEQDTSPLCQVQLNGEVPSLACATQAWKYSFDATTQEGRNILSILLAAQVSKQNVTIEGKGTCSLSSSSEDLRHVYINTPE